MEKRYGSFRDLLNDLKGMNKTRATKGLTKFYANARFRISHEDFKRKYVDGANDGGIDFFNVEDSTYYIFQTKFQGQPRSVSSDTILNEFRKLKNTLTGANPNERAREFVNMIRRDSKSEEACLELVWLTTNEVEESVAEEVLEDLQEWRRSIDWSMDIDFIPIDRIALDTTIYDVEHGFVPFTGKRSLKLEEGDWIQTNRSDMGVRSVVCCVNVNHILSWFKDSEEIDKFLQKNVRQFLGKTTRVNREMAKSYLRDPEWFWFKHNGIIIFVDNLTVDEDNSALILRNPQVVNGGQTLKTLFQVYDNNKREDNGAKVVLRIYRLPYEDTKTYERSIEVIKALNSQHQILASDLRSTDPRQVRIEQLMRRLGSWFRYKRKRGRDVKSGMHSVLMRNLAMRYHVCKKNVPHDGVARGVEDLFEDDNRYDEVFNESKINRDLHSRHIVIDYVTVWVIDQLVAKFKLLKREMKYRQYTKWFVLWDVYRRLMEWKKQEFDGSWRDWMDFIESEQFKRGIRTYSKGAYRRCYEMIPDTAEARAYFKSPDSTAKLSKLAGRREFNKALNRAYDQFE